MWFSRTKKEERIYLDYASATPICTEAREAYEVGNDVFGNPGSIHHDGVNAATILEESRVAVARELAVKPREVIFTSGGTESNNIAILGRARRLSREGVPLSSTHWIVSSIEHPSVLDCFSEIECLGGKVTHVDPDRHGVVSLDSVDRALRPNTELISIGWANHEIGVVQPIREISHLVREKNPATLIHSDAGQAPLYLAPHVHTLGVDLLSLDSGKLYGPRGVGALYLSNRAELAPVLMGGGQERGLRPGTENVVLVRGFAAAVSSMSKVRQSELRRLAALRDSFLEKLQNEFCGAVVNGEAKRMVPHILNISLPGIQSEYVTLSLDARGISISTKSACREGENRRSHVVAMLAAAARQEEKGEGDNWRAENTLRFSFGRDTTRQQISTTIDALKNIIAKGKS